MFEEKSCLTCDNILNEPFIACAECKSPKVFLCLSCFAKGEEKSNHQSSHDYEVVKNNFPLLDSSWTAKGELLLLEAISDRGLGNWDDVSNQVPSKNKEECESHYFHCYVESPNTSLPEFPEQNATNAVFPAPVAYKPCDDPPRPRVDSQTYVDMAGYMAARGDFCTEYDNYAEHDICHMQFTEEDDEMDCDLKLAVLSIYNHRLRERARRKKILAKYGLINIRKAVLSMRRYDRSLGRHVNDGLLGFMHLVEPISYDLFIESLHYEAELKHRIKTLQDFRQAGLTHFFSTKLYTHLRQRRAERKNKPRYLDNVLDHIQNKLTCQQWLHRQVITENKPGIAVSPFPTLHRRPAPPIDVEGLPGYDKLNGSEKELCSRVRLVPESYLEFKTILINEYQKLGHLRLGQARNLIKIDVNKTRKLFDFLVKEGYIKTETTTKTSASPSPSIT